MAASPDHPAAVGMVGWTAARLGDSLLAFRIMDGISGLPRRDAPGEHLYQMASIAAVPGQPEESVRLLYQAYASGFPHTLRLHRDMDFESLRGRTDFQALVRPKG